MRAMRNRDKERAYAEQSSREFYQFIANSEIV